MFKSPNRKNNSFSVSAPRFLLLTFIVTLALYHWPLFNYARQHLDMHSVNAWQTLLAIVLVIALVSLFVWLPLIFISRRLFKLVLGVLALTNGLALYFMTTYGVIIDRAMISNILNTDTSEAGELFHWQLIIYLLILGGLPILALCFWRIKTLNYKRLGAYAVIWISICIAGLYSLSGTWLWIDKHSKTLGAMVLPWGYIINTGRYWHQQQQLNQVQLSLPDLTLAHDQPRLVVLVIGETARSENFSLYGYKRNTNPLLNTTDIVAMQSPTSCSTYTTASIRCMLAHDNPDDLDAIYEYLPTYLTRQGVDVIWHSNNWGEPPIEVTDYHQASQLYSECIAANQHPCDLDDVLLHGLVKRIQASDKDKILVVLHQKGSHGPAYNERYRQDIAQFFPVCESVNLSECSKQSLINAYDNTLLQTDNFLYQVIEQLKQATSIPSVLVYMSDHGESLGESGLYLHGAPMSFAPKQQIQVPMLVWMSPAFKQQENLDTQVINQRQEHRQGLIFHSVLGALGFNQGVYQTDKDIFAIP